MAGRARTKAIIELLDRQRRAHFDLSSFDTPDENTQSVLAYVEEYLARGRSLNSFTAELSETLGFEVWRSTLERVLEQEYGKEAVALAMRQSRVRASHSLADESKDLVDNADGSSSSAVSKAGAQARARQWLAEKFSPEVFGVKQGVNVTYNIGQLHLSALQTIAAETARVTGGSETPVLVVPAPDTPPVEQ